MVRTWAVQTLITPPWQKTATRFDGLVCTMSSSVSTTFLWKLAQIDLVAAGDKGLPGLLSVALQFLHRHVGAGAAVELDNAFPRLDHMPAQLRRTAGRSRTARTIGLE